MFFWPKVAEKQRVTGNLKAPLLLFLGAVSPSVAISKQENARKHYQPVGSKKTNRHDLVDTDDQKGNGERENNYIKEFHWIKLSI